MKKDRMQAEFRAEGGWEPHAVLLPLVDHVEADAGHVGPQQGPHRKWKAARQLGEHTHRLKLRCVDIGLARPADVVLVFGPEADVVDAAPVPLFLAEESEVV